MSVKKTKKPRLTGELARKIPWLGPKVPASDLYRLSPADRERWEQAHRNTEEQRREKFDLLAQRYGIPLDDEKGVLKLLFAVCNEFIPGFRDGRPEPKQKGGRPIEWDFVRSAKLLMDVDAVIQARNCKQRKALRALVHNPEYRPNGKSEESIKKQVRYLENRLIEAKRFWGPLVPMLAPPAS